ncbi:MAG: hypothetical protein ACLFUS_11845 [Candidatus Sumerlaeia bacterium]
MGISMKDREVLRELASELAEIAALPEQEERMRLHRALNGLRPERPVVMIDQIAWHEMNVDDELTVQSEDAFCQWIETGIRRTLYQWKHMPGDMVVEPFLTLPKSLHNTGFGIRADEEVAVMDPDNQVKGHLYHDQLSDESDIEKIKMPTVELDAEKTAENYERASEIFDGILPVKMIGRIGSFSPWDRLAEWRGAEAAVFDLAMRPDYVHALMRRITDASLHALDQLEAQGILGPYQGTVHCTGAWCDELAATQLDNESAKARDCWTFAMAQIFSTVSPAMHAEFEIPYISEYAERFGMLYYGCCEPLDDRIDVVRKLPNLRKISMSPWVNVERGAESIGRDFVFSRKPSPAFLARDCWLPDEVERDLRETAEACKRHGCPLEFILKDISTVHYEPQRLWEWNDIAMRVAMDFAG